MIVSPSYYDYHHDGDDHQHDQHDNNRDQQGDGYQVLMEDGSLEGSGEELIANTTLVNIIIIMISVILS